MSFVLHTSHDFGSTYKPEKLYDDLEEAREQGRQYDDSADRRWVIRDDKGTLLFYGKFQRAFINGALEQKKKGEPSMVTTDDPVCLEVLRGKGIEVLTCADLLTKLTGKPKTEIDELLNKPLSQKDVTGVLETLIKWKEEGKVTVLEGVNEPAHTDEGEDTRN